MQLSFSFFFLVWVIYYVNMCIYNNININFLNEKKFLMLGIFILVKFFGLYFA